MKKYIPFLFFSIVGLTACNNNDNKVQLSILKDQLNNAIELLKSDNTEVYREMEQKMQDPQTKPKAEIWQPRVKAVATYTNQIVQHIDYLIKTINEQRRNLNKQEKTELYQQLIGFEKNVKAAVKPEEFSENPFLRRDVSRKRDELALATFAGFSSDTDRQQQLHSYFSNTSILGESTMLYKIQFDALDYCRSMVTYFNAITTSYRNSWDDPFSSIATLSSSYLKRGQPLIVYVGMGFFNIEAKPKFSINGKSVPYGDNGLAIDTFLIDKNPGDYSIRVTIKFTAPDGRELTKSTSLKYTVAN